MVIVNSTGLEETNRMEKRGSTPVASWPKRLDVLRSWFEKEDFLSQSRRQKDADVPLEYDV